MFSRVRALIKRFGQEDEGTVAILFGLMSVALVMLSGLAVDYNRVTDMRERIGGALDSASLAAGRAMLEGEMSDSEVIDLAKAYFNENVKNAKRFGAINDPNVSIDRATGSVHIDVNATIKMTLGRLAGIKQMSVPVSSDASFQQRDIEVGMALDVTGSMKELVGGTPKIDALKSAFETFANRLIPDNPDAAQRVRIGVAPYSAGVNLGSFVDSVNDKSKDGCVTERKSGGSSDAHSSFFVKADGAPDKDPTQGMQTYFCPTDTIVPLTSDKDVLIDNVNAFTANGSTAGHIGAQWAWNLVSDQWGSVWGSDSAGDPYSRVSEGKLVKAVVLMTDGIFNTAFHGSKSSIQAVAMCDAMKAKGVKVFSVIFGEDDPTAVSTMQQCASPGTGYFANASNAEELEAAFSKFAGTLTALRLTK